MKKIEKIVVDKTLDNSECIVIYNDGTFKRYRRCEEKISTFIYQTKKSKKELIESNSIEYMSKNKYDCYLNYLENLNKTCNKSDKNILIADTILTIILSFLRKNIQYFSYSIIVLLADMFFNVFILFKYRNTDKRSEKLYRSICIFLVGLSFTNTVSIYTHDIKNIPYLIETLDSSEDYNETRNIDAFLEKVSKSPYLSDEYIKTLYNLRTYLNENKYLDLNDAYKTLMTIDVNEKYFYSSDIDGFYNREHNFIELRKNDLSSPKVGVLTHEYMHSLGHFGNKTLNEGMTSILARDCLGGKEYADGYREARFVTLIVISIIGKDKVLEAYTKKSDDLLEYYLSLYFKDDFEVEKMYELFDEFACGKISSLELTQEIKMMLKDEYKDNINSSYNIYEKVYDYENKENVYVKRY